MVMFEWILISIHTDGSFSFSRCVCVCAYTNQKRPKDERNRKTAKCGEKGGSACEATNRNSVSFVDKMKVNHRMNIAEMEGERERASKREKAD